MAELSDLINFAVDKNPIDFATAFSEIVQARCVDAIEAKRIDMATALYRSPEEEYQVDDEDWDTTTDLEDVSDEA